MTQVDYVIHVSVDGMRGDLLKDLVANSPAEYPNFHRLRTQSASTYNARSDYFSTDTVLNHVSMITGRPVNQPAGQANTVHHGFSNNFPGPNDTIHAHGNPNVPYKSSTFDVVHDHGLSTALYASKTRLEILNRSYNATNGAADLIGEDDGRAKIDFSMLVDGSSNGITSALVSQLRTSPPNYAFIHLVEPDTVGHQSGWDNLQWNDSVKAIDDRLGAMFAAIDGDANLLGHTAIVLTGDHGGVGQEHSEPSAYENYNVPLFVWGAGLPANSNLYDLALNRFDPGMGRPDFDDPNQPWRNGDTGNLALMALGLSPIPGSTMIPTLVPESTSAGAVLLAWTVLVHQRRRGSDRRGAAFLRWILPACRTTTRGAFCLKNSGNASFGPPQPP
jgi:hypothetical protein